MQHDAAPGVRFRPWPRWALTLSTCLCCFACDRATAYDAPGNGAASAATQRINDEAASVNVQPICDGSDGIRFTSVYQLGWPSVAEVFSSKYASRLITIDGRCNFWLYDHGPRGLRTGVVDTDLASRLPDELHFGRYSILGQHPPVRCEDCGTTTLTDITGQLESGSGLTDDAPVAGSQALARARRLFDELDATAEAVWQPIRIRSLANPQRPPDQAVAAWTAPLDLGALAVSAADPSSGLSPDTGVLLEDEAALALLSELRLAQIEAVELQAASDTPGDPTPAGFFVRDLQGDTYQLLYRDEPPEPVKRAISATVLPP